MCNYENGKKAIIYILAYEGTNDIKWANKAVSMLDQNKINYLSYRQWKKK